ncbi:MAG: hypothetical protein ACUVV6_05695 [Thermoplasmatota archaeon]
MFSSEAGAAMGLLGRLRREGGSDGRAQTTPAEEKFHEAVRLSDQERHGEALMAFRKVLELDPSFQPDVVHYGIALAYQAQGMDGLALEELSRALQHNPANVEVHIVMGTVLARQSRFDEAAREYEQALSMSPGHELAEELRRSAERWRAVASGETLRDMKRNLALFIEQAHRQFNLALDLTPQSLSLLDGLIDAGWTPERGGMGVLRLAGTYMGEVIIRNLGGEWRVSDPPEESEVAGLGRAGVKPFVMALEKFKRGRGASLFEIYMELAAALA